MALARSQMGKTTLLIKLLKFFWLKQFKKIYIFCPTFKQDTKWSDIDKFVKSKQVVVYPEVKENLLKKIWKFCQKKKVSDPNYHTLILMDDCVGQDDFKTNSDKGIVNKLVCKGNHCNISTIYSVQKITNVSTTMRLQSEGLLAFYMSSIKEKNCLFQEFGMGTSNQFLQVLDLATVKPYDYLYINRQGPGAPDFYHNFRLIDNSFFSVKANGK